MDPTPGRNRGPAHQALERLREGNRRFVTGTGGLSEPPGKCFGEEIAAGQQPFAVVLGCSDSRVPVEILFDQGFGDLFVVRVAGNVVTPSQVGSIEFAVESLGARLVVVLGHSGCGAVQAALEGLGAPPDTSPHLRSIVDQIAAAVKEAVPPGPDPDPESLMREAVRANVRASVRLLLDASDVLERRSRDGELLLIGAEYSLETGHVEFLEGCSGGEA